MDRLTFSDTFKGFAYFSDLYPLAKYSEIVSYEFEYLEAAGKIWEVTSPAPVPLPAAAPLLLAGTAALIALRRRQRVVSR